MSESAVSGNRLAAAGVAWQPPDARRLLQLALVAVWLLDAVLQYQAFMFTKAFGQMLAETASGNPGVIAGPITWNATLVEHNAVALNAIFATIQLAIAIGIAWRPTVKLALAGSIAWSLGVWWFGEGLGGILTGGASPVNGAPGAVLIYALLAVLLWPADRDPAAPYVAGRAVGTAAAKAIWLVFWGSMVFFTLQSANLNSQGLHDMISDMASGEPGWLASAESHAASLVAHHGVGISIILAVAFAVIAVGVFLPRPAAKAVIVLALVVSAFIWVIGEALGEVFTGGGTDPNSGPLLALLALLYWPGLGAAAPGRAAAAAPAAHEPAS